jgi:predicted nucleotidyltransferase component of viral defense system
VAGEVRLFEHSDFEQAMLRAAEHHGVSEQFVEKDYYVTEILRVIAAQLGDKAMFKGGTSLSKGWGLISRFSEDIDLFVNPEKFEPRPGKNKMDKILKGLADAVGEHPALTWLRDEGVTIGGLGRQDHFAYDTRFAALPGVRAAVRLEPGVQSGTFPAEVVPITSLVAQYLQEQGSSDIAKDLTGFDMTLLHYRRTFVEKMFALHGKVVRLQQEDHPLGRDARHYPDLYVLAGEHEVRAMLGSPEYEEIRKDYDAKSREFFPKSYRPPDDLSFAASTALFPDDGLREQLGREYETQCELLFSGSDYPPFEDVLARFEEIRNLL